VQWLCNRRRARHFFSMLRSVYWPPILSAVKRTLSPALT
jgi:hypothetical protein